MWINNFKAALIRKDVHMIDKLISEMPDFSEFRDMEEAAYLLREANNMLIATQNETANSMMQIKKNIRFLRSTQTETPSKLDITL